MTKFWPILLLLLVPGVPVSETSADDAGDRRLLDNAERTIEAVRKTDVRITLVGADDKPLAGWRLKLRLARHEFLFGAAVALGRDETAPQEKAYRQAFASLFNYATTENIMKWKPLEPTRGDYRWDRVDRTLDWCAANGVELKSHCLIWGTRAQGVPDWLLGRPRAEVLALMKERIEAVMGRYRGRIRYYDVINEPIHCHVFDDIAGPDHLDQVCRWARNADPDACLIVNEYNLIADPSDRRRFIALMKRLIDAGAPVDGIGIQAHNPATTWHSPAAIVAALDELATLGKDLHVTELTLKTEGEEITGGYRSGRWTEEAHAEYYRQVYTLCFGHPGVKAITTWAVFDSRSWQAGGGVFDREGRPKAAARALEDLIHRKWHTEAERTTDVQGRANVRGFKGAYDVEVVSPAGKPVRSVRVKVGAEATSEVRIRID